MEVSLPTSSRAPIGDPCKMAHVELGAVLIRDRQVLV